MHFRLVRRLGHCLAVAEEGHFERAAARLAIFQPPLTARMPALECELGVRLVERTGKGARPTREGETLLPLARRVAGDAGGREALVRELREEAPIRLCPPGEDRLLAALPMGHRMLAGPVRGVGLALA